MALRMISESQPIRAVDSILAEIRTLTTRAGDPHLTALLHESVAKHEAQVGNLDEARRHLRIANNLLDSYPNVWFEQRCALKAFCIEFLNSDLRKAEQHLKHASRTSCRLPGHHRIDYRKQLGASTASTWPVREGGSNSHNDLAARERR